MSVSTATTSFSPGAASARRTDNEYHADTPSAAATPGTASSDSKLCPACSADIACGKRLNNSPMVAPAAAPASRPSISSKRRLQRTSIGPRR